MSRFIGFDAESSALGWFDPEIAGTFDASMFDVASGGGGGSRRRVHLMTYTDDESRWAHSPFAPLSLHAVMAFGWSRCPP